MGELLRDTREAERRKHEETKNFLPHNLFSDFIAHRKKKICFSFFSHLRTSRGERSNVHTHFGVREKPLAMILFLGFRGR